MSQKLSLRQHMDLLGLTPFKLYAQSGVEQSAIERALAGQPISYALAVKLCQALTTAHNLDSKVGRLQPEDLGLNTWKPTNYQEDHMQRNIQLRDLEATDQVRIAAAIITRQRAETARREEIVRILQSPQGQQLLRQVAARNQRTPTQSHAQSSGLITRNGKTIDLAKMQLELARDTAKLREIERRVARERTGYR